MKKKWMKKIPLVIGAVALGAAAFSGVVMLLWNATLTPVLHISAISIWQAAGILLLSKILFSGFRGRRGMGGYHKRKMMQMKWQTLTDEQKQQFQGRMHGCCGYNTAPQA